MKSKKVRPDKPARAGSKNGPEGAGQPARRLSIPELAQLVLAHPEAWFETPNPRFGGRRPQDLMGTAEEVNVYNVLNAVDKGLF